MVASPRPLSPVTAEAIAPQPVSPLERKRTLEKVLAKQLRLGYEIESQAEFGAVVFTPSPRRWLWTRKGRENQRITVAIDEVGGTSISRR
jgi:hypothetical protein